MKKNQITKAELNLQISEEKYEIGTWLHYRGYDDGYLLKKVISQESDGAFLVADVSLPSFAVDGENAQRMSLETLQRYYRPVTVPMDKLHALSLRLLDGEEIEDLGLDAGGDDTTSLMHLGDKNTLVTLRSELANSMQVAEMVRKHTQCIVDEMRRKMMKQVEKVQGVISQMRKQTERLDYVIQTIETYAGIKEEIITIQTGIPADGTFPVVIRQAVIYLDEEMALIDPEFDWQKMESFDKWLVENENYKLLLPDVKSIVAIKPRRREKKYTSGETAADRYYNWVMNQNNRVTLFLIRNGENLYRLESEHIYLIDRMFPNTDEYKNIIEEEKKYRFYDATDDNSNSALFRKRFTKVSFLLQGLMERSEVFAPHNFTGSLIKMEGLDGQVEMHYELDTTRQLSDGRPVFREWLKNLNSNLSEGKRVLLINSGYNHSGYSFDKNDFVTYYSNEWNLPGYPADGVYTLYKSKPGKNSWNTRYAESHPFVIKYFSDQDRWTWEYGYQERKNRISIHVSVEEKGILNYDDLKMEDVDYYLNSRLHRSQYSEFVVMLQKVKQLMLEEQKKEEVFIQMMVGQILSKGLQLKDGYTPEKVAYESLQTVKNRLKWKRPVSTKEKETYTMVERNLFSKQNLTKYFK